MSKTEDIIREMAESVSNELDLELVDVEYVKEGGTWFVRIYIDKPDGITHDDCQDVSERIGILLDEKDPILHSYVLEVSSPGIERPLKKAEDYERFKGSKIRLSTYSPVNGKKEFAGKLGGLSEGNIIILVDGEELSLPLENAAKVRLEADF